MNLSRFRLLICSLAAGLFAALPLRAVEIESLIAKLRVEVEKSVAEAKAAKTGSTAASSEVERNLARLEAALIRESYEEAEQTLAQLAVAKLTLEAKGVVSELQRELPKAADARQKAFAEQVGAALEKAGKACLAAKTETALDATLAELGALRQRRAESGADHRSRLYTRLDGAVRFINRWQDYLTQTARGYESTARAVLRELADPSSSYSGSQYYPIVTRAEILARLGKDSDAGPEELLRGVKNLDDLPKAIAELQRLNRQSDPRRSGGYEGALPLNDVNQIQKAYAAFKAGAYGEALHGATQPDFSTGPWSAEIGRLKTLLLLKVLPRHIELPDNPQPKEGENPSEFLLRLATEGTAQGNWTRVSRALDAYRNVAFALRTPPVWVAGDLDACQAFVAGQNFEKAGRYGPAVIAYQRALKSGGKYSPQQAATARLATLEKEQPSAFAEATKDAQLRELLETIRTTPPPGALPQ